MLPRSALPWGPFLLLAVAVCPVRAERAEGEPAPAAARGHAPSGQPAAAEQDAPEQARGEPARAGDEDEGVEAAAEQPQAQAQPEPPGAAGAQAGLEASAAADARRAGEAQAAADAQAAPPAPAAEVAEPNAPPIAERGQEAATPAAAPAPAHHPHIDYSRFSAGPRAVPRRRGASLRRAEALGIGGYASTRELLWNRPSAELLAAVPGKAPKTLLWPVVGGVFGRGFGYTRKLRPELRHNGVDIGAPEGAVVRAVADGLVIYSDNTLHGFGNAVIILHPGGWTSLYAHTQRVTVQPGYYVKRGERIALVGHTGMAWGPHLHFEFRDNGRWRDPERLFVGRKDATLAGPLVDLARVAPDKPKPPAQARPRHAREAARAHARTHHRDGGRERADARAPGRKHAAGHERRGRAAPRSMRPRAVASPHSRSIGRETGRAAL